MATPSEQNQTTTGDSKRLPHYSILRLRAVISLTGLARSTIYLRIAEGTFPSPINLGSRAVGWLDSEIQDWLEERVSESRNNAA